MTREVKLLQSLLISVGPRDQVVTVLGGGARGPWLLPVLVSSFSVRILSTLLFTFVHLVGDVVLLLLLLSDNLELREFQFSFM